LKRKRIFLKKSKFQVFLVSYENKFKKLWRMKKFECYKEKCVRWRKKTWKEVELAAFSLWRIFAGAILSNWRKTKKKNKKRDMGVQMPVKKFSPQWVLVFLESCRFWTVCEFCKHPEKISFIGVSDSITIYSSKKNN
jgi:hypothetical protein